MTWLLSGAVVGLIVALIWTWRKWIAPWRRVEEMIALISSGKKPSTFLLEGAAGPRNVALALEQVFNRQTQLEHQIAERASGTNTVFAALQDGLLVVDTRHRLTFVNRSFQTLFASRADDLGRTVLEVIRQERLDLRVMLGAFIGAEVNNPSCPWGGIYPDADLARNLRDNRVQIEKLIGLANRYPGIISSVSAGNEATVEWTDHLVPVESVVEYVRMLKRGVRQPVTFCENYLPRQGKLEALVAEVDFISLHTYPIWEFQGIAQALSYTQENYRSVSARYPGTPVVITEAGWATASNGRGIPPGNAGEEMQQEYYQDLTRWSREQGILTFVFEAFDEPWKGSADPADPEKHWGLFTAGRKPKRVMRGLYPELR